MRLAALAASFFLTAPAWATSGLVCEGEGASLAMGMGNLPVLAVIGASADFGGLRYATGPERGEGEPFVVGQQFAEAGAIWVDFVDPNIERILFSLRIKLSENELWTGTLATPEQWVDVECAEG